MFYGALFDTMAGQDRTCQVAILLQVLDTNTTVFTHSGTDSVGGFLSGLAPPILGLDLVVAMVAVGLWGDVLGRPDAAASQAHISYAMADMT